MKSKLKLKIKESAEFISYINIEIPNCKVAYTKFSDMYTITSNGVKHKFSYYEDRESRMTSKWAKDPKELIVMQVVPFLVLLVSMLLLSYFEWNVDYSDLFIYYLLFTIPIKWIFNKVYPHYQENLQKEHKRLLERISAYTKS